MKTKSENKYGKTIAASFIGYIIQAIVNNFTPLLYVTFVSEYRISLSSISLLLIANFAVQMTVDLSSAHLLNFIGYRRAVIIAHISCFCGFVGLSVLPDLMSPFAGIFISTMFLGAGGGLLEVIISPIIDSCPSDNKSGMMSLLHSFYCWGQLGVVLLSTLFFRFLGIENWKLLALIWALVPFLNLLLFLVSPIPTAYEEQESKGGTRALFRNRSFLLFVLLMICAGAIEIGMAQWASAFAETALGVPKTVGDICGPAAFAGLMGIARIFYSKVGAKVNLRKYMAVCGVICLTGYLLASFSPIPLLGLCGCGLCGLGVGVLWPGTYSEASGQIPDNKTALFSLLALSGDVGCVLGSSLVGVIASFFGGNLSVGLLTGVFFSCLLLFGLFLGRKPKNTEK